MKKLDDEQLSRVLSAVEGGVLGSPSQTDWGMSTVCLVQTADIMPECRLSSYSKRQVAQAKWFDRWRLGRPDNNALKISADEFLAELEKAGIA